MVLDEPGELERTRLNGKRRREPPSRRVQRNFMRLSAFLFAIAALVATTVVQPQDVRADASGGVTIVNGVKIASPVSSGVLLDIGARNDRQELVCSGVMIGGFHFLTAAHCFCKETSLGTDCQAQEIADIDVARYRVFLQHGGISNVREIFVNPSWRRDKRSDVAVVRLSKPVTTQRPAKIIWDRPDYGTTISLTGFGNSGEGEQDFGLKRAGDAIIEECPNPILNGANYCWRFKEPVGPKGQDANTCEQDDGGPTYGEMDGTVVLTGLHSRVFPGCEADSLGIDTSLPPNRPWIQSIAGLDFESTNWAGPGPFIGDSGVDGTGTPSGAFIATNTISGDLGKQEDDVFYAFSIPDRGTRTLFTINGNTYGDGDYDFFVRYGLPPTDDKFDCSAEGPGGFGACDFDSPKEGTWWVRVKHVHPRVGAGRSIFQITALTQRESIGGGLGPNFPEKLRSKNRTKEKDIVTMFWTDASDDEDGFELQRKVEGTDLFSSHVITNANDEDVTDFVNPELEYTYRVRAFNASGFSLFSNECIVGHPSPRRPTRVEFPRVRRHKVKVTWHDRAFDETGYQLQRKRSGNRFKFETIAEFGPDVTRYTDRGVEPGITYEYRVRAIGRLDQCIKHSLYSRAKSVITLPRRGEE